MKEIPDSLSILGSGLVMLSVVAFALEQILRGWWARGCGRGCGRYE